MTKPPSWNQIRSDAARFATRWADETDENASAQTFWNEFLAIFGVDRKRVAVFEKRAERLSTGGRGRIDVFWPGVLIAEHKSAGKDLDTAEEQAIDYLESIDQDQFPGLLVVSDFARMRVSDLGGDRASYEFPLADLAKEVDRFAYLAGYSGRQLQQSRQHEVDIAAARLMGSLYDKVAAAGFTDHETSVFLIRMLFVLFGDDTGLWEKSLFLEFIETRTQPDGSDLGPQLALLFQTLDRPEGKRAAALDELLARFPYVNGGLFADRLDIPSFGADVRNVLIECSLIDWGSIVPAIFGSLFQAVKSKEARRLLGEHYTTEQNILKTIGPLFLDELRAEYEVGFHDTKRLNRLRDRLGDLQLLDPACGCGNFLIIAYRELRQLELDIMVRLSELTGESQLAFDATLGLKVSPAQFHGIEVEEWPARIAETAMFLIDHQCNQVLARTFGEAPDRLPISTTADIHIGNALRVDWAQVLPPTDETIVLGNPPFIGMSYMSAEQQQDNRAAFEGVIGGGSRTGRLDYVACWYAKTVPYLKGTRGRCAFVSTNSITQGEQARTLGPFLVVNGFEIDFAHRTFRWTSEAPGQASVHVVVVGFSPGGQAKTKRIFDYPYVNDPIPKEYVAKHINMYLLDAADIAVEKRYEPMLPGLPTATQGSKPWDGGHLLVEEADYAEVAADPICAKYLRPFRQGADMLRGVNRWCLWLPDAEPAELRSSALLQRRLADVATMRRGSPTATVRELARTPYLFVQDRQPGTQYFAMPETSSGNRDIIPGQFLGPDVIAGNTMIIFPDAPVWLAAYLQSTHFTQWVATIGGKLKSDVRISPGLTYFAFPFPAPDDADRARLEAAIETVFAARAAHPNSTLADLYDPLVTPPDLLAAHRSLDKVIDAMFGLKDPTEGERLAALIRRYETMASEGLMFTGKARTVKKKKA